MSLQEIQAVKDQLAQEYAHHKTAMTTEMNRHNDAVSALKKKIRELKDLNNNVEVSVYANTNEGDSFDWSKVARVPRPTAEEVSGQNLAMVARLSFNALPDEVKDQLQGVSEKSLLPRVIDGALMIAGKDSVGQPLTAHQKRELRNYFRDEMLADRLATAQNRQHQVI